MLLRRIGTGVPLAVFVAVLAHVAGFGRDHAPGTGHAIDLFAMLAVAFVTLASAIVVRAFAAVRDGRHVAHRSDARSLGWHATRIAGLAALAAIAFAAIEACEGNANIGGSLRAIAALLPLATLIALLSRRAHRSLHALGSRIGVAYGVRAARGIAGSSRHRRLARVVARSTVRAGRRHGRAPPRIA